MLQAPLPLYLHGFEHDRHSINSLEGKDCTRPCRELDLAFGTFLDVVGTELEPVSLGGSRKRQRGVFPLGANRVAAQKVLAPFF